MTNCTGGFSSLADATPEDTRVLLVESTAKLTSKHWHRQRAHLVLAAMRRFGSELVEAGFVVDHRRADGLRAGLHAHVDEFGPDEVVAMEPASWNGLAMLRDEGVTTTRNNHFTCHWEDFDAWLEDRTTAARAVTMEDFYRWQRVRLDVLMEGDEPVGGRWNFDAENREPPPTDGRDWPTPVRSDLDDVDRAVLADLDDLGPDATVPIAAAEGFVRQVIGWREYVWGLYWRWMPDYRDANHLDAHRPLPPVLDGQAETDMACVDHALKTVHDHGYAHHIQRLMVLGNLDLLAGVDPGAMVDWMWRSFVDSAEWVMLSNVVGMALYADGGRMATKPYAATGTGGTASSTSSVTCWTGRGPPTGWGGSGPSGPRPAGPTASPATRSARAPPGCATTVPWPPTARSRTGPT